MKKRFLLFYLLPLLITACASSPSFSSSEESKPEVSSSVTPSSEENISSSQFYSNSSSLNNEASSSNFDQPLENTHRIIFNSNGGTLIADQYVMHGEKIKKPDDPIRIGYTFLNWSYQGENWSFIGYVATEDMVLNAEWEIITFNISYLLNGGINASENPDTYTVESNISLSNPTRTGYDFVGWEYEYNLVDKIDVTWLKDITLVANWSIHRYNITYYLDGGENSPSNPSYYTYESNTFSLNNPKKPGYNFAGWYSDQYYENYVSSINRYSYGDINLYAKWQLAYYHIYFTLNGGNLPSTARESYTLLDSFELQSPTRTGYTFLGWYDKEENKVTSISAGSMGDIYLHAKWNDGNTYTITLDVNGGDELDQTVITVVYNQTYSIPTPTWKGHTFKGWYYDEYNALYTSSSSRYSYDHDLSLQAHWTLTTYSITYKQGSNAPSNPFSLYNNPTSYTIENEIVIGDLYKEGYTFLGWFDNDGNKVNSIPRGTTGNIVLTAKWNNGNYYTVTLDYNDRMTETSSLTVQYNHNYSLPIPSRKGATFSYWTYKNQSVNTSGKWPIVEDCTLTARWKNYVTYTITYNLGGGTNNSSNPSTYTVENELVLQDASKQGYTFLGWFDNDDNKVEILGNDIVGNVTLTAKWSANKYSLSVVSDDTNKGSVEIVSGSGYTDELVSVKAETISDNVFIGWYVGENLLSKEATFSFNMPSHNYSLVGKFLTKEDYEAPLIAKGIIPTIDLENRKITYGFYPQTLVEDENIIENLNAQAEQIEKDRYEYDGHIYAKYTYPKIYGSQTPIVLSNGESAVCEKTYWFEYEPIEWDVLKNDDGVLYLLSSRILDTKPFDNHDSNRSESNNYKESDIRAWLNDEFYQDAFLFDDSYIDITEVDNSNKTTELEDNNYTCPNTFDKVFLPSLKDMINPEYGFSEESTGSETRIASFTDWARIKLEDMYYYSSDYSVLNGDYWTRSPRSGECPDDDLVNVVCSRGDIVMLTSDERYQSSGYLVVYVGECVYNNRTGVRPAITFNINR